MFSVKLIVTVPSDPKLHSLSVYRKQVSSAWLPLIRIEIILLLRFLGCFVQQISQELHTHRHYQYNIFTGFSFLRSLGILSATVHKTYAQDDTSLYQV